MLVNSKRLLSYTSVGFCLDEPYRRVFIADWWLKELKYVGHGINRILASLPFSIVPCYTKNSKEDKLLDHISFYFDVSDLLLVPSLEETMFVGSQNYTRDHLNCNKTSINHDFQVSLLLSCHPSMLDQLLIISPRKLKQKIMTNDLGRIVLIFHIFSYVKEGNYLWYD